MFRREPTQAITEEATPPISWWLGEIMIYLKLCWHFGYFSAPLYGDIEFPQKAGLQLWQATHNTIPGFRHYAGRSRVALLFGGQQWQRHTFAILNCKTIRHSRPLSITPPQSYKLNNIQCIAFLLQILSQFSCRFAIRRKAENSLTTCLQACHWQHWNEHFRGFSSVVLGKQWEPHVYPRGVPSSDRKLNCARQHSLQSDHTIVLIHY